MSNSRTLRVNGVPFTCDCGCNVFTVQEDTKHLKEGEDNIYKCNACHELYAGVNARKNKLVEKFV